MKRNITSIMSILTFTMIAVSPQLSAWTVTSDFESGQVGNKAEGKDAFTSGFSKSVYTKEQVLSGSQAMKTSITQGTDGYGDWGGLWQLPSNLGEGDEYWFRVWAYFPQGFDFSCGGCAEGVKFMRSRTANAGGGHEGYQNFFLSGNGMMAATSVNTDAFYGQDTWPYPKLRGIGAKVTTGQWHAFEVYLKLSGSPGKGVFRAWQNGKLVFEDKTTPTLRSSSSKLTQASVWTYWNNNAPKTQSAYLDGVIITSERPSGKDAQGNSFIGTGSKIAPSSQTPEPVSPPTPPLLK